MDEEQPSIPIAVGQDVTIPEKSSGAGMIVGTIIYIVILGLLAYGIYYYFFRKATAMVTSAAVATASNTANATGSAALASVANMTKSPQVSNILNVVASKTPVVGKLAGFASKFLGSSKA